MRNILLLLVFVFANQIRAQETTYTPIPEENAHWVYHYFYWCDIFGGVEGGDYSIVTAGDTVINAQTYTKLVKTFHTEDEMPPCAGMLDGYFGAFRNDIVQRRVYFVNSGETAEYLLYDFTLEIGDTLPLESFSGPEVVVDIDTIELGGTARRRFLISECEEIYLIEGVGSTFELIDQGGGCETVVESSTYLQCFQHNTNSIYPDSTINCNALVSVGAIDRDERFTIFPNPSHGRLYVQAANEEINLVNATLNLYNLQGRLVLSVPFNPTTPAIDLSNVDAGMYLIEVVGANKVWHTEKLLVN